MAEKGYCVKCKKSREMKDEQKVRRKLFARIKPLTSFEMGVDFENYP